MTGHFTTLDGCERWEHLAVDVTQFYRVPFSFRVPCGEPCPITPSMRWDYRMYELESIDYKKGLAHYVEVYQ